MKNILIPTTFESDTLQCLKIASEVQGQNTGTVVLFSLSALSDSITELLFLSENESIDQDKKKKLLDKWNTHSNTHRIKMDLKQHHQYGLARPIFSQILERYKIDMAIVPLSFQKSRQYIHRFLIKLLHRSRCPMMLLPNRNTLPQGLSRALFLDHHNEPLTASVQNLPFHVIHHSMIKNPTPQSLQLLIDHHHIDLIVQGKKDHESAADNVVLNLGLPVLTF